MIRFLSRPAVAVLLGAVLLGLCVRGAWPLVFVALVPWLLHLDTRTTLGGTLRGAWAMSVAFTAAAFTWFGAAIGDFTHTGTPVGVAVLLLAAPLFQPQVIVFAVVRHAVRARHGAAVTVFASAAAWVAAEWAVPKVLGDTLGQALYPSVWLRQVADLGGTAGLTLLVLLVNGAVAAALARRRLLPLVFAAGVPLAMAAYGAFVLQTLARPADKPLRVGLIQSNLVDYERLRAEKGADAVVREVLDTHYAMTYDAVERHKVDAVLWSETVYPTTFGHPKSEAGATLDGEILEIVESARVPFVFGTYDVDGEGEYNAAAFVAPDAGLVGFYRKTRLFPLTEHVPAWLDGPVLRELLPWAGTWQPGAGARVFPLRLADGREVPVLPLICLDDVDTSLAVDGARQGARAILTMSNDGWFTRDPLGARLHQAAAAFRSIETRLPQFRVTSNGHSGAIDATGAVHAATGFGERTLAIGELPVGTPPRTLVVAWGDWVGRTSAVGLVLLVLVGVARAGRRDAGPADTLPALPASVVVLSPGARVATAVLRGIARGSLLAMAVAFLCGVFPTNTFAQIRLFAGAVLLPELVAWLLLRAHAARATREGEVLRLSRGSRALDVPLGDLRAVVPWRVPLPGPGLSLHTEEDVRVVACADPAGVARALGWAAAPAPRHRRGRLDHPAVKFVLFPLLLALPAFRLHQHIAYGGTFGEYEDFGLVAYLSAFGLWWAAWAIAVVVSAAALRAVIEAGAAVRAGARPALERLGLAALYLGLPAWLAVRTLGS